MNWAPPASSVAREPCRRRLAGPVFAREHALGKRREHDLAEAGSREAGITSPSITRQSAEYCGWLETSGTRSSSASAFAARICSARHSDTPM